MKHYRCDRSSNPRRGTTQGDLARAALPGSGRITGVGSAVKAGIRDPFGSTRRLTKNLTVSAAALCAPWWLRRLRLYPRHVSRSRPRLIPFPSRPAARTVRRRAAFRTTLFVLPDIYTDSTCHFRSYETFIRSPEIRRSCSVLWPGLAGRPCCGSISI